MGDSRDRMRNSGRSRASWMEYSYDFLHCSDDEDDLECPPSVDSVCERRRGDNDLDFQGPSSVSEHKRYINDLDLRGPFSVSEDRQGDNDSDLHGPYSVTSLCPRSVGSDQDAFLLTPYNPAPNTPSPDSPETKSKQVDSQISWKVPPKTAVLPSSDDQRPQGESARHNVKPDYLMTAERADSQILGFSELGCHWRGGLYHLDCLSESFLCEKSPSPGGTELGWGIVERSSQETTETCQEQPRTEPLLSFEEFCQLVREGVITESTFETSQNILGNSHVSQESDAIKAWDTVLTQQEVPVEGKMATTCGTRKRTTTQTLLSCLDGSSEAGTSAKRRKVLSRSDNVNQTSNTNCRSCVRESQVQKPDTPLQRVYNIALEKAQFSSAGRNYMSTCSPTKINRIRHHSMPGTGQCGLHSVPGTGQFGHHDVPDIGQFGNHKESNTEQFGETMCSREPQTSSMAVNTSVNSVLDPCRDFLDTANNNRHGNPETRPNKGSNSVHTDFPSATDIHKDFLLLGPWPTNSRQQTFRVYHQETCAPIKVQAHAMTNCDHSVFDPTPSESPGELAINTADMTTTSLQQTADTLPLHLVVTSATAHIDTRNQSSNTIIQALPQQHERRPSISTALLGRSHPRIETSSPPQTAVVCTIPAATSPVTTSTFTQDGHSSSGSYLRTGVSDRLPDVCGADIDSLLLSHIGLSLLSSFTDEDAAETFANLNKDTGSFHQLPEFTNTNVATDNGVAMDANGFVSHDDAQTLLGDNLCNTTLATFPDSSDTDLLGLPSESQSMENHFVMQQSCTLHPPTPKSPGVLENTDSWNTSGQTGIINENDGMNNMSHFILETGGDLGTISRTRDDCFAGSTPLVPSVCRDMGDLSGLLSGDVPTNSHDGIHLSKELIVEDNMAAYHSPLVKFSELVQSDCTDLSSVSGVVQSDYTDLSSVSGVVQSDYTDLSSVSGVVQSDCTDLSSVNGCDTSAFTHGHSVAECDNMIVDGCGVTDTVCDDLKEPTKTGQVSSLVKHGLKTAILNKRRQEGKPDIDIRFDPHTQHELTKEEQEKDKRRRFLNKKAAATHRLKDKAKKESNQQELQELADKNAELKNLIATLEAEKERYMTLLMPASRD